MNSARRKVGWAILWAVAVVVLAGCMTSPPPQTTSPSQTPQDTPPTPKTSQTPQFSAEKVLSLKRGMSPDQIIELFGVPDRVSSDSFSTTWGYGFNNIQFQEPIIDDGPLSVTGWTIEIEH